MIKKAKFLAKEAKLRINYMRSKDCIFCKIIKGEIKNEFLWETPHVAAFKDINPAANVHILIIPKEHIDSVLTINDKNSKELLDMFKAVQYLVKKLKLDAFRLSFNGGKFQHVPHMHMHLLAGSKIDWSRM